jgi:arginase
MPVAHLLGYGEEALTSLAGNGPAILPQNLCLIGQRSWEEAEAKFLRSLEVRTITMPEIERIGMGQAFTEALWRVSHGPARFGISLDLDVFDPSEAPGVGSPVPGGAKVDEVLPALAGVGERPDFVGLELVEFDPRRDRGGKTVEVVRRLVAELWKREPDNE